MTCVIMQPHYLPWTGYFNLIAQADVFVFLDDVQLTKPSWQVRNRILIQGQEHFLTVPTIGRGPSQTIAETEIRDTVPWRRKHLKLLEMNYGKHPFGNDALGLVSGIENNALEHLADLNIYITIQIAQTLGLPPTFFRSSALSKENPTLGPSQRSERLVKICEQLGAHTYLSPIGSKDYLEADAVFTDSSVALKFQDFTPAPYPQLKAPEFVSSLSIFDTLAHLGPEHTLAYIS